MTQQSDLAGRTAVVTGGASGIGRATAVLLARHGAIVTIGDYSLRDENIELFSELGIQQQQCDVRSEAELEKLINQAASSTGRLDILVNNAGIGMVKQIDEVTEEDWDRTIDTNLKSAFFGSKHAIRWMTKDGQGGAIVNIASNAGILPRAHDPVYSISKLACTGLTRSLGLCHSKDKIRVNAVCPGPVGDTGMMNDDLDKFEDREAAILQFIEPSPIARAHARMISPEEVAQAVLYLVSDAAIMVSGTMLTIDGGKSLGVPPSI
jgi:NAD(P)-dependent dehydrogenase (short-subunit alcohol dehydrogenase family)